MSVRETPEQLQRQMARLRRDAREDFEEVVDRAEELTDWRYYVQRHPWVCMGAAAVLGYLLVPPRYEVVSPDAEALLKLARKNRLVVEANPDPSPRRGLLGRMLGAAGHLLVREAISYAGRRLGDAVDRSHPPPTRSNRAAHRARHSR